MSSSIFRNILKNHAFLKSKTIQSRIFANTLKFVATSSDTDTSTAKTVTEVKHDLLKYMGLERGYKPLQSSRHHLLELLPASQAELPPRTMQDSYSIAIIPLSSNVEIQEKYVTFLGHVRLGRLMEDMDIFAVWVTFKHIYNPQQSPEGPTPYVIVTVLVDQIDFTDVIPKHDADIRLSGHVSWVGKSSIETTVWLEQKYGGEWHKITRATFLMAARNSTNTAAAPVNALIPETDREKDIFSGGEKRKQRRVLMKQMSLLKSVPNVSEQHLIHNLFLNTVDLNDPTFHKRTLPSYSMWMENAKLSNIVLCHPEDRNMHNRVFGGFLMRQALELAWTTGYFYSKYRPKLAHISDISFHQPVGIGSLLRMDAYIVYTEANWMHIVVYAEVYDPHSGHHKTTNMFHYTFQMPEEIMKVIPQTYDENMMYLDGRRHFQQVMGLNTNSKRV